MALAFILMFVGALETGLKFRDFRWLSGGELSIHGQFVVIWLVLGFELTRCLFYFSFSSFASLVKIILTPVLLSLICLCAL